MSSNDKGADNNAERAGRSPGGIWSSFVRFGQTPFGRRFLFWFAVALSAFAIFMVGLEFSQEPFICQYCHAVRGEWEAWQVGPHRDVGCESCHVGPGTLGFLFYLTDASVSVFETITGDYRQPIKIDVSRRECVACHEEVTEQTIRVDGIIMSHKETIEGGLTCTRCHAATGHPQKSNVFFQEAEPRMATCAMRDCHTGRTAANDCGACYTEDPLARGTR